MQHNLYNDHKTIVCAVEVIFGLHVHINTVTFLLLVSLGAVFDRIVYTKLMKFTHHI